MYEVVLWPGPEIVNLCSTQLIVKLILLLNVKMSTIVDILTFIGRINTTSNCHQLKGRIFFLFFSTLVCMSN